MKKMPQICLIIALLIAVTELMLIPIRVNAQNGVIIVEDADYVWNNICENSTGLTNVTKDVSSRIRTEYGDFSSKLDLNRSDELNQAAHTVTTRTTVEYTDFISLYSLQSSENIGEAAISVAPRIIVEYADFVFKTDLGPKPMDDITPPFIDVPIQNPPPGMVMPHQNVTVSVNITDAESGVKNATLQYSLNNSATWTIVAMSYNSTTGLHYAIISRQPEDTYVKYKIVAYDNAENMAVEDHAKQYYTYTVIPEFPSLLVLPLFIIMTLLAAFVYVRRCYM